MPTKTTLLICGAFVLFGGACYFAGRNSVAAAGACSLGSTRAQPGDHAGQALDHALALHEMVALPPTTSSIRNVPATSETAGQTSRESPTPGHIPEQIATAPTEEKNAPNSPIVKQSAPTSPIAGAVVTSPAGCAPIGFGWKQVNNSRLTMTPLNEQKFHVVISSHEKRADEDNVVALCKSKGYNYTYYFHRNGGPDDMDYWDDPDYLYPNKAQDTHAALRFIVDHYADLPEIIAFNHGNEPEGREVWDCFRTHDKREDEMELFLPLTSIWLDRAWAVELFQILLNHPLFLPPEGVDVNHLPHSMKTWCCPNFIASRKSIQRNSFEFWRNLYRVMLENAQFEGYRGKHMYNNRNLPVKLASGATISQYTNVGNLWEHGLQVFMTGKWDFSDPWKSPEEACQKYLYCERPGCQKYAERQWHLPDPVRNP